MQVNLSLASDTKQCLNELMERLHCGSASDVVTRLVWDAKHRLDVRDEQKHREQKSDRSDVVFGVFSMIAFTRAMMSQFECAFRCGFVYSQREYEALLRDKALPIDARDTAFIWMETDTLRFPRLGILKSKVRAFAPVIADAAISSIGQPEEISWLESPWLSVWNVNNIGGLQQGEVIIQALTANYNGPDKLGIQMLPETKLALQKAVGFEIVHKSGKRIECRWNEVNRQFDVALFSEEDGEPLIMPL